MNFLDAPISAGLGLILGDYNDKRQLRQQDKLNKQNATLQKELTRFQNEEAFKMWQRTNYQAQTEEMRKAGLNIGLMYKGAGQGGTLQNNAATVNAPEAPKGNNEIGMGLQLGLQNQLQKAQIENIRAQTEKTKIEAAKTAGVDTQNVEATTAKIKQETMNAEINQSILALEKEMQQIQNNITNKTQEDIIREINAMANKTSQEAISAAAKAKIDNATVREQIKQIRQTTTEQQIRIAAQKANIKVTESQIQKIANDIYMAKQANMQAWDQMSQQDRDRAIKRITDENQNNGLEDIIKTIFMMK